MLITVTQNKVQKFINYDHQYVLLCGFLNYLSWFKFIHYSWNSYIASQYGYYRSPISKINENISFMIKAHKESKLTHLRNFDNFEFLHITKKKNKSPRWNRYKCSLWLPTPSHTYFNKYTSTKWQKQLTHSLLKG